MTTINELRDLDEADRSPYDKAAKVLRKMSLDTKNHSAEDRVIYATHADLLASKNPQHHQASANIVRQHDTVVRDRVSDAVHRNSSKQDSENYHKAAGLTRLKEQHDNKLSEQTQQGDVMSTMDKYLAALEGKTDFRDVVSEKTLTAAELDKREQIARAIQRENPSIDKSKKIAIATAVAKKVAEDNDLEEAKDVVKRDPKTGKVISWSHGGDWEKAKDKKDLRGKVTHASDVARRQSAKMAKANEGVELLDEFKQGQEYTRDHIMKKIKSGNWEAVTDIKPGKHVEMRHHSGKRVFVKVKHDDVTESVDQSSNHRLSFSEFVSKIDSLTEGKSQYVVKLTHNDNGRTINKVYTADKGEDHHDIKRRAQVEHGRSGYSVDSVRKKDIDTYEADDDQSTGSNSTPQKRGRPVGSKSGARH
jgi:hypothetical protein